MRFALKPRLLSVIISTFVFVAMHHVGIHSNSKTSTKNSSAVTIPLNSSNGPRGSRNVSALAWHKPPKKTVRSFLLAMMSVEGIGLLRISKAKSFGHAQLALRVPLHNSPKSTPGLKFNYDATLPNQPTRLAFTNSVHFLSKKNLCGS